MGGDAEHVGRAAATLSIRRWHISSKLKQLYDLRVCDGRHGTWKRLVKLRVERKAAVLGCNSLPLATCLCSSLTSYDVPSILDIALHLILGMSHSMQAVFF